MSILERYANQTVECIISGEVDQYGDPVAGSVKKFACRKEPYEKVVLGKNGDVYLTKTLYFIPFEQLGRVRLKCWMDTLDGNYVAEVTTLIMPDGRIEGYEVLV
ncbi:MAG: hypothetical protein BWY47_00161 [Bacteroidetes bacterium ADurb.Bin302]|nr:MAG: hypothetical protein BWY47_00161 [Bacteroidetes bacterium ADurb.Bin302]